ncbi:MAG: acyltransferase family protein, partial [Bacillota bacterium]
MNINNLERYDFINLLKGFGILLVVWGHTMIPRSFLIYSFHMPLFFFISGFLYKYKPWKEFIVGKVNRLYLPYAIFTVLSWVFYLIMLEVQGRRDLMDEHFLKIISLVTGTGLNGGNDPIWFLTCLLMVCILFWWLDNLFKKAGRIFLAALVISWIGYYLGIRRIFLPFKLDVALTALLFYFIGYYCRQCDLLQRITKVNRFVLVIVLFICATLQFYLARLNIKLTDIPKVSMISNNLGNYFLFYIPAIFAIVVLVILGYRLKSVAGLNFLGRNSLVVLASHKPLLFLFNVFFEPYMDTASPIYGIAASVAAIVLSLP